MKPPCKVKRERSIQALHPVGVRKIKPKKTDLKKKVWFNLNKDIISSVKAAHQKNLNKLTSIKHYNTALRSKSQNSMGKANLGPDALRKSFSSLSTSLRPGSSAYLSKKSSDYPVSSYDDSCLADDFFTLSRNVPRKGILKNKSVSHLGSGSLQDSRHLWKRIIDINLKTSENVLAESSQSIISDSMTRLCTHSKSSFKSALNNEAEMGKFDDLTFSVRKLQISHFSLCNVNKNVKKYLLLDPKHQCNDLCHTFYDDANSASKSFAENYLSMGSNLIFSPNPWQNTNNSAETSEEEKSSNQIHNDSENNYQPANTLLILEDNSQPSTSSCKYSKNKKSAFIKSDKSIMNVIPNFNTSRAQCHVTSPFVSVAKSDKKSCINCDKSIPKQCVRCCFPLGLDHCQKSEDVFHQSAIIHCPVVNCDVCFTNQELFNKHIISMKHSPCNPLKTLFNGTLPFSCGFLCPLCGHSFLHMKKRYHYNTAFSFVEDEINPNQTSPIPVPYKIMSELILRCQQVRFTLFCQNCNQYLQSPEQLQFHISSQHIVQSGCEQTITDVFSSFLTDQSCADCHQFIYTDLSQKQLCIHKDCPLQGPVLSIEARSLKEFILRCGITDINVVTENDIDLDLRVVSSTSDTLVLNHFKSDLEVNHSKTLLRHRNRPVTDVLTYSESSSIKKTFKYNMSAMDTTFFPYVKGASKHCLDTDDYFKPKLQLLSKQLNATHDTIVNKLDKPSSMLEHCDSGQNKQKLYNKNLSTRYIAVKEPLGPAISFFKHFKHKTKIGHCKKVIGELCKIHSELHISEINLPFPIPLAILKGNIVFDFQEPSSNESLLGNSKTSESSNVWIDSRFNCNLKRKSNFSEVSGHYKKIKNFEITQHETFKAESFLGKQFPEGGNKISDHDICSDKDDVKYKLNTNKNKSLLSCHLSENRPSHYQLDKDHEINKHNITTKSSKFLLKKVNFSINKNKENGKKIVNRCLVSNSLCVIDSTSTHDSQDEFENCDTFLDKAQSLCNCSHLDNNWQSNCSSNIETKALWSSFNNTDLDGKDVFIHKTSSHLNYNFEHSENRAKQQDLINSKDQYYESKITVNENIRSNSSAFKIKTLSVPSKKKRFRKRQRALRSKHCKARKYKNSLSQNSYYKFHNQQPAYINLDTTQFKPVNNKGIYLHKENVLNNQLTEPCLLLRLDGPLCSASATSTTASTSTNIPQFPNLKRILSPQMNHLILMDRIIFADLENFMLFKFFHGSFSPATYVWGFIGARPGSPFNMEQYFYKYPVYLKLKTSHCVHISTEIGTSKDAADFAMCLAIAKLDDRLPTSVPFFIVSRDTGFQEVKGVHPHI
ncbi:hypothetical protein Btru_034203 [Bulinus truncatus]|nr:hypothetical protein Btru_034203 [Bulinus truncatus]